MMGDSSWGLMVLKVLPDTASTNLPSMSSCKTFEFVSAGYME